MKMLWMKVDIKESLRRYEQTYVLRSNEKASYVHRWHLIYGGGMLCAHAGGPANRLHWVVGDVMRRALGHWINLLIQPLITWQPRIIHQGVEDFC